MQQYWAGGAETYRFISAAEMAEAFRRSALGKAQAAELAQPPQRTEEGVACAGAQDHIAFPSTAVPGQCGMQCST